MTDCCDVLTALAPPLPAAGAGADVCPPPYDAHTSNAGVPRSAFGSSKREASRIGSDAGLDKAEFSRKVERELPFLRRMVRRWHRDHANADDLVQETVLRALANAHLWVPGSNLRGWLLTIMRNQFFASAAKSKRTTELLATMAMRDTSVPESGSTRLRLRDVQRTLRRLPIIQRTVLVAVAIDSRSYAEVAEALGLSVGAVRCHLARARERLRAAVEGESQIAPFGNRNRGAPKLQAITQASAAPRQPEPIMPPVLVPQLAPSYRQLGARAGSLLEIAPLEANWGP